MLLDMMRVRTNRCDRSEAPPSNVRTPRIVCLEEGGATCNRAAGETNSNSCV